MQVEVKVEVETKVKVKGCFVMVSDSMNNE
jgi:hypothetical protein